MSLLSLLCGTKQFYLFTEFFNAVKKLSMTRFVQARDLGPKKEGAAGLQNAGVQLREAGESLAMSHGRKFTYA
jgi:hypothetical protein